MLMAQPSDHRLQVWLSRFCHDLRTMVLALMVGVLLASAPVSAQERGEFKDGETAEDIIDDAKINGLSSIYEQIGSATNRGLENLIPILNTLLTLLLIISLILTFMFGAFQEDFNPLFTLLRKAVVVGFILFFIGQWGDLRNALLDGAAQAGLIVGNSDLAAGSVLDPVNVAGRGFTLALAVLTRIVDLSGPIDFFTNFLFIFLYLISGVVILIAFAILSITVFVALAEFYIGTTVAVILFPLGVLRATSFAAQSAFGYVIASAVKIIVLGTIIGLATSIFIDPLLDQEPDPLQGEALGIAFISLAIAIVAWSASSLAAGLVQGGPALGAGAAVGPAVSVAAGGALALGGAGAAVRAMGGLAGGAGGTATAGGGATGGGGPALSGPGGSPSLGGGGGSPPALPKPKVAGLLPAPGNGSGGSSSSGGGSSGGGGSNGTSANLPAVAGKLLPATAGQSLPATTGTSLPVSAGASASSGANGESGAASGGAGGGSAARQYMAAPAKPPAGEGNGGRGNNGGFVKHAGAYAAQQALMADRGGGGYQGPNLDKD